MQKKSAKLEPSVNWIKADKAYPKKSTPLVSLRSNSNNRQLKENISSQLNINPFNIGAGYLGEETDEYNQSDELIDCKINNKPISMKDLCTEDKQRIANLIKELAKVVEEKRHLEKSLEEERKQKDNEIKDALKQQQLLLNEKEKLLNKYAKTQEKLDQLKRHQRLVKTEPATYTEANNLPLRPLIEAPEATVTETTTKSILPVKTSDTNPFSPFKSSTPRSQSPCSLLSPINIRTGLRSEDNERKKFSSNEDNDLKKVELIKQRIEMMDEQKKLAELLDQQEEMLKEKQSQILLQQKLHRERLEQLNQIRNSEIEHQQQLYYGSSSNFSYPLQSLLSFNAGQIFSPESVPIPSFNQQNLQHHHQQQPQQFTFENNDQLIENLTQQVYKQLLIKRQTENANEPLNSSSQNKIEININKETKENLFRNEPVKIDNHITNKTNHPKHAEQIANSECIKQIKHNQNNKQNKNDFNDEDLEESKLIEDLFFLK